MDSITLGNVGSLRKKVTKVIALNICAVFHKIRTMKGKEHVFL